MVLLARALPTGVRMSAAVGVGLIRDVLTEYRLDETNFVSLLTDNASYCKSMFATLHPQLPRLHYVGCLPHLLHLISGSFFMNKETKRHGLVCHFPRALKLTAAANELFATKMSKSEQVLLASFKDTFHRSARRLFWLGNTRWTCTLTSLITLVDNLRKLREWVDTQLPRFAADDPVTLRMHCLRAAMGDATALFEATVLHQFCDPLRSLIIRMQAESVLTTADALRNLEAFIDTLRLYSNPDLHLAEGIIETAAILLPADRPSDAVKDSVTAALRAAASHAVAKYQKHTVRGNTLVMLKAVRDLSPANLRTTFAAVAPPPEWFSLVAPRHVQLTTEWVKFRRFDGLPPQWETASEMRPFWRELAREYPLLSELAERVLTTSSGIAGVERELKALRKIQAPDRLSMSMQTLEALMLIRCNRQYVDPLL